jgi:hypothetical protein
MGKKITDDIHGFNGRTVAEEFEYLANLVEAAHEIGRHPENATYTMVFDPNWKRMIVIACREEALRRRP